jgi:chaperonin cofactor prefoldin
MIRSDLGEKEVAIKELRETVEILELKLKKMDQLSKLKDAKIQTLVSKLQQAGLE